MKGLPCEASLADGLLVMVAGEAQNNLKHP